MEKRIKFTGFFILLLYIFFSSIILGYEEKKETEKIPLQDTVKAELTVRGTLVKQRYTIRFSTEETKHNFKILTMERDIPL